MIDMIAWLLGMIIIVYGVSIAIITLSLTLYQATLASMLIVLHLSIIQFKNVERDPNVTILQAWIYYYHNAFWFDIEEAFIYLFKRNR
jgi:hypothetical protein